MTTVLSRIAAHGVVPVVTLEDVADAEPLGRALMAGGLPLAEVTFRTAAAEDGLALLSRHADLLVGAGTVISAEQVDRAAAAGARFIVSPGTSRTVVERARAHGLPIIPGAVTATEVQSALELGLTTLKFFPAAASGGPAVLRALGAPFPQVRFMPTGGVTAENLSEYLSLPGVAAAGGSWMVPPELVAAHDEAALAEQARRSAALVAQIRSGATSEARPSGA